MNYRYNEVAEIELHRPRAILQKRAAGLGPEFLDAVDSGVTIILQSPTRWPDEGGGVRRCRIRRFPYALFYRMTSPDDVEIVAVGDHADGRVLADRV